MKRVTPRLGFQTKNLRILRVSKRLGSPAAGRLQAGNLTLSCSLGRAGLTSQKREGDGKTPMGRFLIQSGYLQRERFRALGPTRLSLTSLRGHEGWCDDPRAAQYNRPVRLPYGASHEILKRNDGIYDVILVLDYNHRPCIRGRGSAIFFHLTRARGEPTAGCIAIAPQEMRRLLPRLARQPIMVIG